MKTSNLPDANDFVIAIADKSSYKFPDIEEQDNFSELQKRLLALIESDTELTPDNVGELIENSLFMIQALRHEKRFSVPAKNIQEIIVNEIKYLLQNLPPIKRNLYYRMGLSLSDCIQVENSIDQLEDMLMLAPDYLHWHENKRVEFLVNIVSGFILSLEGIKRKVDSSMDKDLRGIDIQKILAYWLLGYSSPTIKNILGITHFDFGYFLKNTLIYQIIIGTNALTAIMEGKDSPEITSHLSILIEHGTHNPIAAILMQMGLDSRSTALQLASTCPSDVSWDVTSVRSWLKSIEPSNIPPEAHEFIENQKQQRSAPKAIEYQTDILISEEPGTVLAYDVGDTEVTIWSYKTKQVKIFERSRFYDKALEAMDSREVICTVDDSRHISLRY